MAQDIEQIQNTIIQITDDLDNSATMIKGLLAQIQSAITATGISDNNIQLVIGPGHLTILLADASTKAAVFRPVPVIPLDENGDPLPALPSQGPCGTLNGVPLLLDPLATDIGVALRN